MERLVMKIIYLRNIWRESVMRQVSLKLSSLSLGISQCCCKKEWLPLPAQDACSLWVQSLCIWRGFGWVSFHMDQARVPACLQAHKHLEETVVTTGRLVWKERWNRMPCPTAAGSYARQWDCKTVTSTVTVGESEAGSGEVWQRSIISSNSLKDFWEPLKYHVVSLKLFGFQQFFFNNYSVIVVSLTSDNFVNIVLGLFPPLFLFSFFHWVPLLHYFKI